MVLVLNKSKETLSVGLQILFPIAKLCHDKTNSKGDSPVQQETWEDQEIRQCESSYTAEEDASSRSKSLSSDSKVTHLAVTATEDVTKDLLPEKNTSAPLLDREPEENMEQETQEDRSQGMLRNRRGMKGELMAACCCSSTIHMPTLCIGVRKMVR